MSTRRRSRTFAATLLALGVAGSIVFWSAPVMADPTPAPAPAPAPAPGPSPSPPPGPGAGPGPSPGPGAQDPSPGATTPGQEPPAEDGSDDPGMFDISGQIRKAVNDMVAWVAETGLRPILNTLGDTVLATPDLTANSQVRGVWTASLVLADASFVLFVVAAGFVVAARDTVQSRYGLKQTLPRLFVGALAANLSLIVCAKGIEVANAVTAAIAGQGVDGAAAAAAIRQVLEEAGDGTNFLFSMLVIAALVMAIVVVLTFILRIAMLVILIGVAPIALLCHANPHSEGIAYAWWRAFAACLAIQLGQAAILVATLKVFLTPVGPTVLGVPSSNDGWLGLLICVAMLWLLIKLPGWTRHFVLGGLGGSHGRGLVGQIVRAIVMVKTLGASAGASRAAGGASAGAGRAAGSPAGAARGGAVPARASSARTPSARGSASARRGSNASHGTAPKRPAPGPAAFSHSPATHAPLPQPAGANGPVTFSDAVPPAVPRTAPPGGTPVSFSHPDRSPSRPAQPSRPAPVRFSNTSSAPAVRGPGVTPPAAPVFSAAERPQKAPKRPPAPATPVFSAPPADAAPSRSAKPGTPVRRQPRSS